MVFRGNEGGGGGFWGIALFSGVTDGGGGGFWGESHGFQGQWRGPVDFGDHMVFREERSSLTEFKVGT